MSINAVLIIIIILSLFPLLVSLLLQGKYFKLVIPLSLINILLAVVAYMKIIVPSGQCRATNIDWSKCNGHKGTYFLISLFNIVFGIIIWYLAYRQKENDYSAGTTMSASQFALQNKHEGLRKFLTASGGLLAFGIIAFVVLIAVVFVTAILSI